jgi:hypothetical protein
MHFVSKKMSIRRIVALTITIGCHLGLLIVMLEPTAPRMDTTTETWNEIGSLRIRIISSSRIVPASPPVSTTAPPSPPKVAVKLLPTAPRRVAADLPPKPRSHLSLATPPPSAKAPHPQPTNDGTPATEQYTDQPATVGDGGFHQRLLDAERSGEIRGVPGSDRQIVPGIQLADPMTQGVSHVMRQTQRLFGITNHHCIDVEVLKSLTPEDLIARHLTLADVKKEEEKWDCNSPLGLHF